ncbi:VWFA and cache domain-containing protein 1 isoform X2 [Ischnura elegans]|nr:VWFA and cache domain-containing protein 1 isoform X2 [Ischnura elegans]XP_046405660.1 VWFA and cache domain-containing protein 1 isoform X2 [Ischnura elegans]
MKLRKYIAVLNKSKAAIEELFWRHPHRPYSSAYPCCDVPEKSIIYNEHFGAKVSKDFTCDITPALGHYVYSPGPNLTDVFSSNLKSHPTIKWQYFISTSDISSEYPAHHFDSGPSCQYEDTRHRDVFLATVLPYRKVVVIIVDHGHSLSKNQLFTAKAVGKHLISLLSSYDLVGVLALSNEVTYPGNENCSQQAIPFATHETKFHFSGFIDALKKSRAPTNHSLGFEHAFKLVRQLAQSSDVSEALIIYISRGLLSSLEDAKVVLETIAQGRSSVNISVIINTCAVIDDGKPLMLEKHFLEDIADQNFQKYNISLSVKATKGIIQPVNSTKHMSLIAGKFYSVFNVSAKNEALYSLPFWDNVGKGMVVSMSKPCFHLDEVVGVVGMDLHLSDLMEDITYFNNYGSTYSFIINKKGYTIMHPSFPRPIMTLEQPMLTDIANVENVIDFAKIRNLILTNISGSAKLPYKTKSPVPNFGKTKITYTWQHLLDAPYIVVVAIVHNGNPLREVQNIPLPRKIDFVYHRLDLLDPSHVSVCRHFRQMATLDAAALFLSPSCFQFPFKYLVPDELSHLNVQSFMAYLTDTTKFLATPGIKPAARNDLAAIMQIMPYWKKQFRESELNKYIVRRYIVTPRGVFQMYPGSILEHDFDPTRRAWFWEAVEQPGRLIVTGPKLDVGGSGYVVTLSHVVYEGQESGRHEESDSAAAVVAADVTLGFLFVLMHQAAPFCNKSGTGVRCFLMDHLGYLVAHPSLISPGGNGGPVEQRHVTHGEFNLAGDLLNHLGLVRKSLCNSFSDQTIQRFYRFNTSVSGVLTNLVHGEHCIKYQITAVPGTNLFVGIVNSTCNVTTFCPCSTEGRLCLNCNRMEQNECECPCECPLQVDVCTGHLGEKESKNPSCPHVIEQSRSIVYKSAVLDALKPCFLLNCEFYTSQSDCFGVVGCEWCQFSADGKTPLAVPYCSQQAKCFNGVLGTPTPYGDSPLDPLPSEDASFRSTPVGPVAGGIMGFFLVLALIIYCYRHHVHRNNHSYLSSVPETAVRMSQLDNEVDDIDSHEESVSGNNILLNRQEPIAVPDSGLPISPYRVNTGYRRPPGGDSDHGYSTMTPHEDSEHTAEPLLLLLPPPPPDAERRRTTPSLSPPSSSRASSPMPQPVAGASPPPQMTVLPEQPHRMLAPVTVHMVDIH